MKFKFDFWNNRLWKVGEEYNYEIPEEQSYTNQFGQPTFNLDSDQPNHYISFSLGKRKIKVFYKQVKKDESVVCYQKDFPLPHGTVTEFELTETDMAAKWDGKIAKQMSSYKSSF
jgi:hypothetical protein